MERIRPLLNGRCDSIEPVVQELRLCVDKEADKSLAGSNCLVQYKNRHIESMPAAVAAETVYVAPTSNSTVAGEALAQGKDLVENAVANSPAPSLLGTIDSFLPTLLPNVLQTIGELEEPQNLGFAWVPFSIKWLKLRVGAFATPEPKLNPVLEATLIQRGQLETISAERDTDIGDDYVVAADVTVEGPLFGQNMDYYGKPHAWLARTALVGKDLPDNVSTPSTEMLNDYDAITDTPNWEQDPKQFQAAACALSIYTDLRTDATRRRAQARIGEFWRLIHNQPQVTFSGRWLEREDVVGASAYSWRVKLSSGLFNNLDWLRALGGCSFQLRGDRCAARYKKVMEGMPMRSGLGASFYYEAGRLDDLSYPLPPLASDGNDAPLLNLPGFPTLSPEATDQASRLSIPGSGFIRRGWSVGFSLKDPQIDEKLKESLRIDGGIDYYRYKNDRLYAEGDVARLDHNVTRITLTYRRGPLSIPIHLMYRTKTEFTISPTDDLVFGLGAQGSLF